MRFSIVSFVLFILFSSNLYAGVNGLTHASRANCVNNESISWDGRGLAFPQYRNDLAVTSQHYPLATYGSIFSPHHLVATGPQFGKWRVAAIHWGEGVHGFPEHVVQGHHWWQINPRRTIYTRTWATDCNLGQGFIRWGATQ